MQKQQILILHLVNSDLQSDTVGWALYDGCLPHKTLQMNTGSEDQPPYCSVLDAMYDGWRVIQFPTIPIKLAGHEHETGPLPFEYILERMVEVNE